MNNFKSFFQHRSDWRCEKFLFYWNKCVATKKKSKSEKCSLILHFLLTMKMFCSVFFSSICLFVLQLIFCLLVPLSLSLFVCVCLIPTYFLFFFISLMEYCNLRPMSIIYFAFIPSIYCFLPLFNLQLRIRFYALPYAAQVFFKKAPFNVQRRVIKPNTCSCRREGGTKKQLQTECVINVRSSERKYFNKYK